ncbi:MAG TPA: isoprenylcysteine carboxylmethyltransferase family protein [Sedimentisphaerales bacterium]|nr:isoprenylcysteine carboxylmethyltransferase family protein [Sedimentisphaerales bacterium]
MVRTVTVAAYLALWLVLRWTALRLSKPARVRRISPWFTRLVLAYCFVFSVGFVAANTWSEGSNQQDNSVRLAMGIFMVALALVADTICLLSLCPFYSLEMEIKENHAVIESGLYRLVRHPIYLSNIIGFLGLCILMNHWAAWVASPAQVIGFFLMAREEELFLISHLGKEYERYRADVRWILIPGIL